MAPLEPHCDTHLVHRLKEFENSIQLSLMKIKNLMRKQEKEENVNLMFVK